METTNKSAEEAKYFLELRAIKDTIYSAGEWKKLGLSNLLIEFSTQQSKEKDEEIKRLREVLIEIVNIRISEAGAHEMKTRAKQALNQ